MMTPSLAPAVSTAAPKSPATKRHRAVLTNLLLARSLNASPRQRTEGADFRALSMGGTGLEPVTPSLSSPQSCYAPLAGTPSLSRLCRNLRTLPAAAFALVLGLRLRLQLAPVSTAAAASSRRETCSPTSASRSAAIFTITDADPAYVEQRAGAEDYMHLRAVPAIGARRRSCATKCFA